MHTVTGHQYILVVLLETFFIPLKYSQSKQWHWIKLLNPFTQYSITNWSPIKLVNVLQCHDLITKVVWFGNLSGCCSRFLCPDDGVFCIRIPIDVAIIYLFELFSSSRCVAKWSSNRGYPRLKFGIRHSFKCSGPIFLFFYFDSNTQCQLEWLFSK